MNVTVLASGSKGNCLLVHDDCTTFLVDIGISTRRLKQELDKLNMHIEDIDGVLLTHEHNDHIRGLKTLSKRYSLPIYTRSATFRALPCLSEIPLDCCHPLPTDNLTIGKFTIKSFSISHDAADPVGYCIYHHGQRQTKLTIATDLGYVSNLVAQALEKSNAIVLEANHDLNLLQRGPYPWSLKKRILGPKGHLANNTAAQAINRLTQKPEQIVLAHLSAKNNTPDIALNTISQSLNQDIAIHVASQNEALNLTL